MGRFFSPLGDERPVPVVIIPSVAPELPRRDGESLAGRTGSAPCSLEICYTRHMHPIDHSLTTEKHVDTCSSQVMGRAIRLIGDMWTLMIVYNLLNGPKRFGELLEAVGNVSPKTISQRLKMLEEIRFVERQAFAEIPPRVEYRLTEKGLALVDIMEAIQQFGERYLAEAATPAGHPASNPPPCA
jgi:DNA-binding HxlR family transcriptional regulator